MLNRLPRDLANIVCAFAYNATLQETKRSLHIILELKRHYLHPYVKACKVPDYTSCSDSWLYDRDDMRPGLFAPFSHQIGRSTSPFETFFVWFSFCDLWDVPRISQVMYDLDWRKTNWIRRETGIRDRQALLFWIATTTVGVVYCSRMFPRIEHRMLKKYPSTSSRYLVSKNYDEWTAYFS